MFHLGEWGCSNTAHVPTFACLSIWLQRESNWAAAPHTGGSVLARPVTASVVHCTCLWGGEGRDRDAQFPQEPVYHLSPSVRPRNLGWSLSVVPWLWGHFLSLRLSICKMSDWYHSPGNVCK